MKSDITMALIAAVPPTIAGIAALIVSLRNTRDIQKLHVIVNSRLTELLSETAKASRAQGQLDGAESEKTKQKE